MTATSTVTPHRRSSLEIKRSTLSGIALATAAMVLLVLAASSDPVRLWSIPLSDSGRSPIDDGVAPAVTLAAQQPAPADLSDPQPGSNAWMWVVGLVLVALAVSTVFDVRPRLGWLRRSRAGPRRHWARLLVPLPEVPEDEPMLSIDVEAARAALGTGTPRNAIVACWMQLERDADAAGLPRDDAETASEYVERLVASSSVDPEPISQLAALYREARFSSHEMNDDHRARAIAALDRVADVLLRVKVPA